MSFPEELERAPDPLDQATQVSDMLLENALAAQRGKSAPETHPDFDGEHCVVCGVGIPAERLALQKVRCVDCQAALELRRKQHAG